MDARLLTDCLKVALAVPMNDEPDPDRIDWGVPVTIAGPPGGAKSSCVRGAAEECGLPHVNMSPGRVGEGGFGTIAVPERDQEGRSYLDAPPRRNLVGMTRGVIILDDSHLAAPGLDPALMGLTLDRMIGDYRLPGRVRCVETTNRATDSSNGRPKDPAHANRVCHLEASDPSPAALVAHLRGRGNRARVAASAPAAVEAAVLAGFPAAYDRALACLDATFRARPSILRTQPEDPTSPEASGPWASPRSWEMGMRAWATSETLASVYPSIPLGRVACALLGGCVGQAAADLFVDSIAQEQLPDPRALLDGAVVWVPDLARPDVVDVVASRVVEWTVALPMGAERTTYGYAAWAWLNRLGQHGSRDVAAAGARRLLDAQVHYALEHMADLAHLFAWVAKAQGARK